MLTPGATYDMGGNLRPSVNQTVVNGDIYGHCGAGRYGRAWHSKLPVQLGVGLYYQNAKIAAGVDYIYQNWENNESPKSVPGAVNVAYKNTNTVKLGFEYTPNRMDIRNCLKRWSYRVGFRYGTYYQTFEGKFLVAICRDGRIRYAGAFSGPVEHRFRRGVPASAGKDSRFGSTTGRSGWYGSAM